MKASWNTPFYLIAAGFFLTFLHVVPSVLSCLPLVFSAFLLFAGAAMLRGADRGFLLFFRGAAAHFAVCALLFLLYAVPVWNTVHEGAFPLLFLAAFRLGLILTLAQALSSCLDARMFVLPAVFVCLHTANTFLLSLPLAAVCLLLLVVSCILCVRIGRTLSKESDFEEKPAAFPTVRTGACLAALLAVLVIAGNIAFNHLYLKAAKAAPVSEDEAFSVKGWEQDVLSPELLGSMEASWRGQLKDAPLLFSSSARITDRLMRRLLFSSAAFSVSEEEVFVLNVLTWEANAPHWTEDFTIQASLPLELLGGGLLYSDGSEVFAAPLPGLFADSRLAPNGVGGRVCFPFSADSGCAYVLYKLSPDGFSEFTQLFCRFTPRRRALGDFPYESYALRTSRERTDSSVESRIPLAVQTKE